YFVPAVLTIAIISFAVWLIAGQIFSFSLVIAVTVLIIACPCALGLATPTAVMMGTGIAAKYGILIKSGKALQIAKNITTVVFDKTGTLTEGKPKVTDIVEIPNSKFQIPSIIQFAASLEKNSAHPLAEAIILKANEEKVSLLSVENFNTVPGKGLIGQILISNIRYSIFFGNRKIIKENKIIIDNENNKTIEKLENEGKTVMLLGVDSKLAGMIAVADVLKKDSKETIKMLKKMDKEVFIVTGDNWRVAEAIAGQVGANKVIAEVLPTDKANVIKKLQSEDLNGKTRVVAFVGDGINDAPALAQSDLGIALSSGTDIAIETGDIVLIKNNLPDVVRAIKISAFTLRKIKQNLFWAFIYNIIGIPVAAGVLYPITGWLLNPAIAAAAMAFSSVSVVLNALTMSFKKFD
ncbi:heavy metal translocating P-type ATPase, partial [Patescibacteria group bacterium]|nr:heavy metal translocating P-type ATPase [Patescibacteria group bacterium]